MSSNGDMVQKATQELQDLFGKLGKMQAEVSWYLFTLGQLGAMVQIDRKASEAAIGLMRNDVNDFTIAAATLAEQMSNLLDNAESNLTDNEDDEDPVTDPDVDESNPEEWPKGV